jgi:PAS domain S-box-containing protein
VESASTRSHRDTVLERLSDSSNSPLMTEFPHGALFSFDTDLRILSVGGSILPVLGMSQEGIEGRRPSEFLPPETAGPIEDSWRALLAGRPSTTDIAFEGRIFQHELAPVAVDGSIVAGMGFVQDVTRARAAERALADSEQRLRLMFENAPIGEALVELDGRWRKVNPTLCALTGYTEEQFRAMTFQDITHPDDLDQDLEALHALLDGSITRFESEKRYLTASGGVLWVQLSVALVTDEAGEPTYFVSQIQDISERKRQHDALRALTAMMAHDLRGPTGVMADLLGVLVSTWENRTDQQRLDIVRRVESTAKMTRDLLSNSLTVSTIEAQRLTARPAVVAADEALRTVLATVPHDGVDVHLEGDAGATCWVDPDHLVQALTNLVTNAVKYGGDELRIEVRSEGATTSLVVADDGPGVDADFEPLLFERFTRSPSARSGGQKGSGLGLSIVRDLARLNGGDVTHAAAPGGGAAFTLRLPAAPTTPAAESAHE